MSVSPILEKDEGDGSVVGIGSDEEIDGDVDGGLGERLKLPREDEVVKQLREC